MSRLIVLLVIAALVVKFFWLLVAIGVTVLGARWLAGYWRRRGVAVDARAQARAELRARADRQHAAVLAGNVRVGVYGDYPPCVPRRRPADHWSSTEPMRVVR